MSRETLEDLFERYARDADENAIAALVRRSRPRLLAAARRISPRDADDCVQTAYLSLLHKRQEGMDAPVLPWLITAVVRIAYRHKAQHKRQFDLAEQLSRIRCDPPSDTDLADALRLRVDRLPAPYRDAVVLHYIEGLSTEDGARLLEISRASFKKRLQRARAFLRSTWNPRVLRGLFALPWFFADAASAAAIGGLLVTKKAAVAVVLIVLTGGTVALLEHGSEAPSTARSDNVASRPVDRAPESNATATEVDGQAEAERKTPKTGHFGVVVDERGAPVADALIELRKLFIRSQKRPFHRDREPVARVSVRTGQDGEFQIESRYEDYAAVIAAEFHVVAEGHPRTIARVERIVATRIALLPGGRLTVVVRDEDGALVEGVTTLLCERDRENTFPPSQSAVVVNTTTDARGEATYHIAPGQFRVEIHADGYMPIDTEPFEIKRDGTRTLDLVLRRGTLVEVHVVDENGLSIAGADVEVRGPQHSGGRGTTDAQGICRVGGVSSPANDADYWYRFMFWHVEANGFAASHAYRILPQTPGQERVKVVLRQGVSVVVRVVDAAGRPIERAMVFGSYHRNMANTVRRGFSAYSGPDGRTILPRRNPGKLVVAVHCPPFERGNLELVVGTEAIEKEVSLARAASMIRGVVLLPDGSRAKGGKVGFALDDSKQRALGMVCVYPIRADGSFEVQRVAAGAGKLLAIARGFGAQSCPLTVEEGANRDGVELQLRELGTITGKITDRKGAGLSGVTVRLSEPVKALGGGVTTHYVAVVQSNEDGTFQIRGVVDGKYTVRVQSKEWIAVNAFGVEVNAGTQDLVLKMKPASEGSGIKLTVKLTTPVGKVTGYYRINGIPNGMQVRKQTAAKVEFGFYREPGIYDFTFEAPGHLAVEVKGLRIRDRADNPPIEVRFVRGGVLRLRVLNAEGDPIRNETVAYRNQLERTDESGECEFGGFLPGAHDVFLRLSSDRFTYVRMRGVQVPGRETVTLLRHAAIYVKHAITYGELEKGARWELTDADGTVVDESTFDMSRIGRGYARDRIVAGFLQVTRAGKYRVVAEIDARKLEQNIDVALGKRTTVDFAK